MHSNWVVFILHHQIIPGNALGYKRPAAAPMQHASATPVGPQFTPSPSPHLGQQMIPTMVSIQALAPQQ